MVLNRATFRASPDYDFVPFEHLSLEQIGMLDGIARDPALCGVLLPRAALGGTIKSVGHETARLLGSLQQPGPLPEHIWGVFGERCAEAITELVLDGVLEIEGPSGYVTGADAWPLFTEQHAPRLGSGIIGQLSIDALKYGTALALDDASKLSARLYFYNRLPASPAWKRLLGTPERLAEHLGIQPGGPNARVLESRWVPVVSSSPADGWHVWKAPEGRSSPTGREAIYKLYVSPACEALRDVFGAALDVLGDAGAFRVKTGSDMHGLLRPDKLVAYFWDLDRLKEAATRLERRIAGAPAHGVPFTAGLVADGLLSWGKDPPRAQHRIEWQERESWRLWVTNRLAVALLTARRARTRAVEPWRFALTRLRLEGVDTETWTPAPQLWSET